VFSVNQEIIDRIESIKYNKIPHNYKKTKIGYIPNEWSIKKIEDIGKVVGGKRLPKGYGLTNRITKNPYITVSNMYNGGVSLQDIKYVPEEVSDKINSYTISTKDIFISVAGTLGIVGIIPPDLEGANLTENANKITNIIIDQKYLLYVLMSNIIQRDINAVKTISAQPKLALDKLRKFLVPIPPIIEQVKIADILSTWDNAIELKEKLIEQRKKQKRGLMQLLLTGKKRLHGFTGDWKKMPLHKITEYKSSNISMTFLDEFDGEEVYPVYSAGGIYKYVDFYDQEQQYISIIKDGSGVGRLHLCNKNSSVIGTMGYILIKDFVSISYLFYRIQLLNFDKYVNGSSIPHLYYKDYKNEYIKLPTLEEQTAIANILSTVDKEIELLKQQLQQLKEQKKGLMQLLLTGIVRVTD
jgi:type I restriction enzyme, S subunit